MYREVFYAIMEAGFSGSRAFEALPRSSPCAIVREFESKEPGVVAETMPPTLLCHGQADTSAPPSESAKFAEALRRDCVVEMMSPDLDEGRGMFRDRIDERVRDEQDYLVEELLRVARLRGTA